MSRYPKIEIERTPDWARNTRMKALVYARAHLVLVSELFSILDLKNDRKVIERLLTKVEGIIKNEKKE